MLIELNWNGLFKFSTFISHKTYWIILFDITLIASYKTNLINIYGIIQLEVIQRVSGIN